MPFTTVARSVVTSAATRSPDELNRRLLPEELPTAGAAELIHWAVEKSCNRMPYYTRVLSKQVDCPSHEELVESLAAEHPDVILSIDAGDASAWDSLVLSHPGGDEIAVIERNLVTADSLAADEIAEFVEEVGECRPVSAVPWLVSFLSSVRVIYAFQHLAGVDHDRGDEALRAVSGSIWSRGDAILQADGEGFSNEDGYHIVWQFAADVSGPWWMAVLLDGKWVPFQMDLGREDHREAFRDGRVPPDATMA